MKSLSTLIKLQKTIVDDQRQVLNALQKRRDQIEELVAQLEIKKARELEAANDTHARTTYGAFLQGVVMQERALEKERKAVQAAVEVARDKLAILFEEQKRYEIAEAARIADEAKAERRRETLELDEIGSVMHERKRDDR